MLRIIRVLIIVLLLSCLGCQRPYAATDSTTHDSLTVTSTAFTEGAMIPVQYTSDGKGISPPLAWSGAPAKTVTYALIVDDPDAPSGTYVHWVLFNIPASTTKLAEHISPLRTYSNGMVSGHNDRGQFGYTPPSPPNGTHRYYFKVYALDSTMNLAPGATKAQLEEAMRGHVLASGQLMGRYKKSEG